MATNVVLDFVGEATLTQADFDEPRSMRLVVGEDWIVFVADEFKQQVALSDVVDITRDVSRGAVPDASETVAIAFEVGGTTELASIQARADTLVRFQGVLYEQLLGDTLCDVCHEPASRPDGPSEGTFRLHVSASRIRLEPEGSSGRTVTVRRDRIVEFRALNGDDDRRQPEVLLLSSDDDEIARTVICLPSSRYRNLFGRYLKSELQLTRNQESSRTGQVDPIDLLLVDDDPQDLHTAEMFLEKRPEPFSIEMASGVDPGLRVLKTDEIDCIISDYQMPGANGIEFLRMVRDRWPDLPFILYTGKGNEEVAKQAILDDVTDYVEKDVGKEQYAILSERIRKAIERPAGRIGG